MDLWTGKRSGGVIIMVLVVILMLAMITAFVWYAFHGASKSRPATISPENVIDLD